MKKVFISFADTWRKSGARIGREASEMGVFDEIRIFSEKDIPRDFRKKFRISKLVRGCGFWAWKPYIIKKVLHDLHDGDILVYCDAGCHLNPRGRARLEDYFGMILKNPLGILVVQEIFPECEWTKGDVFHRFGIDINSEIANSMQIRATHLGIQKNSRAVDFISTWMNVIEEDPTLIDDSPPRTPNFPGFKENRHDQSVLSVLCKIHGVSILPPTETLPLRDPISGELDWNSMTAKPIWDVRYREIPLVYKCIIKLNALMRGRMPQINFRNFILTVLGLKKANRVFK